MINEFISNLIARVQAAWPVNRVVAVLGPLVFVPAAGFLAAWVANKFPGLPHIDSTWLAGIFAIGAASALTTVYTWLKGWQKHEARKELGSPFSSIYDDTLDEPEEKLSPRPLSEEPEVAP